MAARAERAILTINGVVLAWAEGSSAGLGMSCCKVLAPAGWAWRRNAKPPAQCLNPLPITVVHSIHGQGRNQAGTCGGPSRSENADALLWRARLEKGL